MANKEMKTLTFGDVTYEIVDEKARQELDAKGQPKGIASLDETGKVPEEQLPELGEKYDVGGEQLGLVKNGGNVVINPDGTMTAPEGTGGGSGDANVQSDWNESEEASDAFIKNKPPIEKGEGQNSIQEESCTAIGDNSVAFGKNNMAGCKGYYIKSIDFAGHTIYLSEEKVLPSLAMTDNTDLSFKTPGYEYGDGFNIINGSHYVLRATIITCQNNVITYSGDLGFTEIKPDDSIEGHTFFVPTKPQYGVVAVGYSAFASGENCIATGRTSSAIGRDCISAENYSHTEGRGTMAYYCGHAEGRNTKAIGDTSHAEGSSTQASGNASHSEGDKTIAEGKGSHAEGLSTTASGDDSHAEGRGTKAIGYCSHAEGNGTTASGDYSHTEGGGTTASGNNSHAEGGGTKAIGYCSHTEGTDTTASGDDSHAEGRGTKASGDASHSEGWGTKASGDASHSEGWGTKAIGIRSHTEGTDTTASGAYSHAEGNGTTASGNCSHAEGNGTTASGSQSHAEGYQTTASGNDSHVEGRYNIEDTESKYAHIVGNGNSDKSRSNAHTLDWQGNAWYAGIIQTNGEDYAEYFEWQDGNPNNEDRVGLLVTLDGEKIKLANVGDEILGIISGTVAVLGGTYECEWNGKYLTDDFGRVIYDLVEEFIDVEHVELKEVEKEVIDEETKETRIETKLEEVKTTEKKSLGFWKHPRLNPDYDPEQKYINRSDRPEWDTVGMLGKLYVRDDGTCQVNGYATVGENGIATASTEKTNMRVLSRVNESVVRVLLK